MKTLTAILIALATILGLSACKVEVQPLPNESSVKVVTPKTEPVNPPTVINVPLAKLVTERVAVETFPAPMPEVTAYVPEVTAYVQALPVAPVAPVELLAPVQTYTPTYVAPVVPIEPVAPTYVTTGVEWIDSEFTTHNQPIPANTHFQLTNHLNCGAALAVDGRGGCTHWLEDGTKYITISPSLAYTPGGTHVLWHEVGHVVLNTLDECAVEAYAHQFEDVDLWSYPACMAG